MRTIIPQKLSLLILALCSLFLIVNKAEANDYLEQQKHYTVMSMGNGVLRFTIPIWVYGAVNDYYLEGNNNFSSNDDSYIWYSTSANAGRGGSSVHRIASVSARRYGTNDSESDEGQGFIYIHEGSAIIQSTYNGEKIVLTAGDGTYWTGWKRDMSLKRKNDDDHKRITYITFDWYPPESLQGKDFYWGVSANIYKKSSGESSYKKWWAWPEKYKGGDIPQSPELYEPYIYAMDATGKTGYGCAATHYAVYQEPISYHTSLNSQEVVTTKRSDQIIVPTCDTVQRFFSATFNVYLDKKANQKQTLKTNEIHIPAYHRIYHFRSQEVQDDKGSATGKVKLNWDILYPSAKDLVESDVFEIQRATSADFSNAQTIHVKSMRPDTAVYSYVDDVLAALGTDTTALQEEKTFQEVSRTVVAKDENGDPYAEYNVAIRSNKVMTPGQRVYYRIRRASASVWGWKHDFAAADTLVRNDYLAPLAATQPDYTLDPDYATNRKVHFTFHLDNSVVAPTPEPMNECGWSCKQSRIVTENVPFRIKVTSREAWNPVTLGNYRFYLTYERPESFYADTIHLSFDQLNKYVSGVFPAEARSVYLHVIDRAHNTEVGANRANEAEPYVKTVIIDKNKSYTSFNHVQFDYDGQYYRQLLDSLRNAHPLNEDSLKNVLYQELQTRVAALGENGTVRCNWDANAVLYLQRTLVETGDTTELAVPADSIKRQSDGSWTVHMTDVADVPCVHYRYKVRLDQSRSVLKVINPSALEPKAINGQDLYFNSSARIARFTASQGDDRYGILLNWQPTGGGVDEYLLTRRIAGSTSKFDTLLTTTKTNYRDLTPMPGKDYEYCVTARYTCNDTTTQHSASVVGRRSPYGKISGRIHYEDGIGCDGVTVTISSDNVNKSVLTNEAGEYVFDSLPYYQESGLPIQYTITPTSEGGTFRYNNTTSGIATITLNAKAPEAQAIEFDNISSVRMSGRVLYNNSSIPVRDAQLLLNGKVVKNVGGIVHTDVSGNFEIQVPKDIPFTLQAAKEGHIFENDGYVIINDSKQLTLSAAQDGVRIWDATKVRLAGRVVGGKNQASKPLGFGLSTNNLGKDLQLVLELEGDNTSYIVRLPSDLNKDTLEYSVPHTVVSVQGLDQKVTGHTKVHYQRKRIIINPDPETGEYCADIFPVRYKITQATAVGYATLFANGKTSETIDLSDGAHHADSTVVNNYVARWNERFDITYRSPINISCIQMRYGLEEKSYGEKALERQNILNQNIEIPLVETDSTGIHYLFGAPVFAMQDYSFRVTAHEDYYYNNEKNSTKHEEVRINGGTLKVYNGLHDASNTQIITTQLNQDGQAEITIPVDYVSFLKTGESALRVLDLSVESDGQYVEYQPFKAYIMGNKAKGRDFVTSLDAGVQLLDVLRDPPGSKSYAYLEKGTTYKYNYSWDFKGTFGLQLDLKYGSANTMNLGTYLGAGGGVYTGYTMQNSVSNSFSIPITSSVMYKHSGSYTFTTTDRIETGSDEFHVGAEGDVYIGTTQSIYFGLSDAVKPIDSLTYASLLALMKDSVGKTGTHRVVAEGRGLNGEKYYLVIGEETEAGAYVKGTFAYTEDYIFNTLLPKLIRERDALLLTGDSLTVQAIADARNDVVYWSKVLPDDKTYALKNYTKLYPNGKNTKWINIDDVALYNKQILSWVNIIKQNEREKLGVTYGVNADLVDNYSISNGLKVSHSETYEYSSTIAYRWDFPNLSPKSGLSTLSVVSKMDGVAASFGDKLGTLFDLVAVENEQGNGGAGRNDAHSPYEIDATMPAAKWKFQLNPILDLNFDRDPNYTTSHKQTAGFVLQADPMSYMNVTVSRLRGPNSKFNQDSQSERDFIEGGNDYNGTDYQYGSYVYMLNGGATKCPWEGPEEAIFYEQGGQPLYVSQGTLRLENPKVDIDVHERSDVPHDKPAIFNIRLTNEMEQDLGVPAIVFKLKLDEGTNTKGAKIFIDGTALTGDGRAIKLTTGQIVNKTMEVYAGEDYDYEDIAIIFTSNCDPTCVSKATFSVHYMPVSCEVNISTPHDKWVMNTLSPHDSIGYYMPVVIDGFDVNYRGFDHLEFQYKLSKQSDDGWVNLCSYYANDSIYQSASGTKAMIKGGRIENIRFYGERDPMEQQYDLRAVSFCRHGSSFLTRASAVLSGIKDTRPPRVFGEPEPANAILGVGDYLKLRFNEAIAGNYLDEDNNFQLLGVTNNTDFTTDASVHFTGSDRSLAATKVNRSLANKSFSIDLMVKPDNTNEKNIFFTHTDDVNKRIMSFGIDADNQLFILWMGINDNSIRFIHSQPITPITAFRRVIVTYDKETKEVKFYSGTQDVTDAKASKLPADFVHAGYAPLVFGNDYAGNMLEARVWTKVLTPGEIAVTDKKRLTGYERELVAYYPMSEGKGNTMTDRAEGATLYMEEGAWTLPNGISLALKAGEQVQLDDRYLSRSDIQDATYMFWFRATADGTLFSAASGVTMAIENGELVFRYGKQLSTLSSQLSTNTWHHLVLAVNRTYNTASVFLDGAMTASFDAINMPSISGPMYLGGNGFAGNIDEFTVFEQALPKSFVETYDNFSPVGDEMGLMAYLPFEEQKENASGIMEQIFSINDQRVFKDANGNVVNKVLPLLIANGQEPIANLADKANHAPVRSHGLLTKLYFDWSFNNDELMINLKNADKEINKQSIFITVRDVEDLNGNPMASPAMWTAFVDKNALKWEYHQMPQIAYYGEENAFNYQEINIINYSGKRHQYAIESLPDWVTVNRPSGAMDPMEVKALHLSFSNDLPVGVYSDIIYLTDENGLSDPLRIEYTMQAEPPYDNVDKNKYPHNMSLCGEVMIGNAYDTDANDLVIALYRNECVGIANVAFDALTGKSEVFLTVHGNDEMVRKDIRFQLWQASTGKVLELTPNRKILFAHGYVYGCGEPTPLIFSTSGSETQNIALNTGWNWISFNLNLLPGTTSINEHMSAEGPWEEGDLIKNPASQQFCTYSADQDAFAGTLRGLDYQQIYMVYAKNGNTLRIGGDPLEQSKMQLTLRGNGRWSAMPCLLNQSTPLTEALADYYDHASAGDLIKAHDRFAYFSADKKWVGDLTALRPGEGYLFRRLGQGDVIINFYNKAANAPGASPRWNGESGLRLEGQSATNMTMIATIEGLTANGQKLMAYIGDELVGVATPITITNHQSPITNGVAEVLYFLTISSDAAGSPIEFRTEDGQELTANSQEPIAYVPDSHHGSLKAPVVLTTNDQLLTTKIIENNHVIIIRNGKRYDVTGKKLTK